MGVVDNAVEDGVGVGRVANDLVPFVDQNLAGQDGRAAAIALFEDLIEVATGPGVERFQAPIVEDQELHAVERAHGPDIAAVAARHRQLSEQFGDALVKHRTVGRPALQRLLADITAGRVDIVVIYKIDRLTRSLADFAKIVEILDARGASFVSVTQQFNTTTSMGRLTLNVLLSFAQFEREVIGERIRDKIAASKKKGIGRAGCHTRVSGAGPQARHHRQRGRTRTLDLSPLYRTRLGPVVEARARSPGVTTRAWTSASGRRLGGKPFSCGGLYLMLRNRIYLGEIVHKGQSHRGEHPPIIDQQGPGDCRSNRQIFNGIGNFDFSYTRDLK